MAIADEKIKTSTKRHVIVQVTGKRLIDSLMSQVAGEAVQYQEYYLPEIMRNFKKLVVSGSEYTLDNINALPDPDKFNYDRATGRLVLNKINNIADALHSFVVYFDLFYTDDKIRYIDYTDAANNSYKVEALPKITGLPKFTQSIKNFYSGILSYGQVSLNIDDSNRDFKKLNTIETSFFNSNINFKFYINDVLVEAYTGIVKKLAFNNANSCSISVTDNFNTLKNDATFGDSADDYIVDNVTYTKLDPSKENVVIPYFFGKSSYGVPIKGTIGTTTINTLGDAFEGINIDYDEDSSVANNDFILGRVGPEGLATQSLGTSPTITHNIGEAFFTVSGGSGFNIRYADTFYANPSNDGGAYKEYFCFCVEQGSNNYAKFLTFDRFGLPVSPGAANEKITNGSITFRKSVQACFRLSDGSFSFPLGSEVGIVNDINITETTLASGNKLIKATIGAGLLSPVNGGYNASRNPSDTLLFTMQSAENSDQTYFMKRILSNAGVPFINANIEQSQTDFDKTVVCQIPAKNNVSLPDYLKVAETLLTSTIGFLYFDLNGDIQYRVTLDIDAGSYDKADKSNVLDKSVKASIEYEDIADKVSFETEFYSHDLGLNNKPQTAGQVRGVSFTINDIDAKNLHEVDKTFTVNHCLEYWENKEAFRWRSLVANRKVSYIFIVATELIDKVINDNINLETDILVGENNNENVKILSIEKSTENIKITATDLGGFYFA